MHRVDFTKRLFFFDDLDIAEHRWLGRQLGDVKKLGEPVIVPDRPWEGHMIGYGSVLLDPQDGRFKAWYCTTHHCICYAESDDGLHWEKPALGVHPWKGCKDTNIVVPPPDSGDLGGVIIDPLDEDPNRRFKMTSFRAESKNRERTGIYGLTSPDGIHWTPALKPLGPPEGGDRNSILVDTKNRRYLLYTRHIAIGQGRRQIHGWASSDFVTCEDVGPIIYTDLDDPIDIQFYGLMPFEYRGCYFGTLEIFVVTPDSLHDPGYARLHGELVASRDAIHWKRVCRGTPFLERGHQDTWDQGWVVPTCNPPVVGDGILTFWYSGRYDHSRFASGAMGAFRISEDRFVGLTAGYFEGMLQTHAGAWPGGEMCVTGMHVAVGCNLEYEVLDDGGNVIPGYSRKECMAFGEFSTQEPYFQFASGRRVNELTGKDIAFRIFLRQGTLYSLEAQQHPEAEQGAAT